MTRPLIVDAHEDLAYNVLTFGRDYTRPVGETRRIEKESDALAIKQNGEALIGWNEYQGGNVAVVFSTLFVTPLRFKMGDWNDQVYATYDEAYSLYHKQLDVYHALTDTHPELYRLIGTRADLERHLAAWHAGIAPLPVGLVPLMEGAEGIRDPSELGEWWERGVRIIGPAWGGTRFCGGTREPGPLTDDGKSLLDGMAEIGFTLDISHMDELAARQAIDGYEGAIIASHANAVALIQNYTGNRHLSDNLIKALALRDGIVGVVPFCKFLDADWKADDQHERLPLERVAAHIDHICQLTGNAQHVGIGTDFEGGFGASSVPKEIDTIADLQKLPPILASKGYNDNDIALILGGNWLLHLQIHLP